VQPARPGDGGGMSSWLLRGVALRSPLRGPIKVKIHEIRLSQALNCCKPSSDVERSALRREMRRRLGVFTATLQCMQVHGDLNAAADQAGTSGMILIYQLYVLAHESFAGKHSASSV
jgi:hypothetical protein